MKKLRFATIAVATVALTAGLTPSASAQDFNQIIDNFDCGILETAIYTTGLAHENSTRSELAANLRNSAAVSELPVPMNIVGAAYSERIANRALTCGIVKEDPQDFLSQLQLFSSNLSSSFFTA